jgi:thioredoxin-like negative regulator of GroEL
MKCWSILLCLALAAPLGAGAAGGGLPSKNVAWVAAAADADVDRAFAQAKTQRKPLLLYWGATWCPPCNQLKATLFNRQEFAALARSYVAVAVDGDRPGAQQLGRRFNVSGYPTLVVFGADGTEITRLPGEVDPPQVLELMQQGLAGGRPVKAVLADALAGRPVAANEWRLLAFYSWDTDDGQLVAKPEVPATLARLAAASAAADAETSTRLWLKALAASDDGKGVKPDDALRERVAKVLADPAQTRLYSDVVAGGGADLVRALAGDAASPDLPLAQAVDAALRRLAADTTLSRGDRITALISRVDLARLGQPKDETRPKLPEPLLQAVREHVARDDREITDGYERQAVVTAGAYALGLAGLWADSDALLKANLAKSHSPYYLMSQLAGNARKLGRTDEAVGWYRQAWEKSEGPATRLQWGAGYLGALVELTPADAARIEKTASALFAEAAKDPGSFEGRSIRSLQRVAKRLQGWNAEGRHAAALKRLQAQLAGVCGKVDPAQGRRDACRALLAAPAA